MYFPGVLVFPQAKVDRRTEPALTGPLDELALADQPGFDPCCFPQHCGYCAEGRLRCCDRLQATMKILKSRLIESGADVTCPDEFLAIVNPEDEGAEGVTFPMCVAADNKFLPGRDL